MSFRSSPWDGWFTGRSSQRSEGWAVPLACIFALTILVYGASLGNYFIPFDDNTLIYLNPAIEHFSFLSLKYIFTSYDPELYIPLTLLTYQMMHLAFGFNPAAFHALSLLLHLINIGLVAWIMWQISRNRGMALIVTFLFALHPMQSETVLWAAALKDVLSSVFGLVSVALYLRYRARSSRTAFAWCIVCFALGLLSKVSIAPLPFIFLLLDWLDGRRLGRSTWLEKFPFFALTAVFIVIALAGKTQVIGSAGFMTTALLSFKAITFYLLLFIRPWHLSLLYPQFTLPELTSPVILLSIAVTVLLLCVAFFSRNRHRFVTVGILWFLLFLGPSFSNFYKNEYLYFASNRYVYLAYVGLFFIIAQAVVNVWERYAKSRIPLGLAATVVTVVFACITFQQVHIWNNGKTLFLNVINHYPLSVIAYNNYGAEFLGTQTAYDYYRKALELDPYFTLSYRNIANYHFANGDMDKVRATYEEAMAVIQSKPRPTHDDITYIFFAYAQHLDELGQSARSLELFKKAAELVPNFSEAHYNLGVMYQKYGRLDEAKVELEMSLQQDGRNTDCLYHLASIYGVEGRLEDAANLLERVVALDPLYPNAQRHLDGLRGML